jgi:serine/threonine protein kinase
MTDAQASNLAEVSALSGRIFGGCYRVETAIGKGGMSVVYRAVHLPTKQVVALKVMSAGLGADEKKVLRFEQEARASTSLQHPSIIRVLDYGRSADGLLFIAMELLSGRTLGQRLKEDGPLSISDACRVLKVTCDALAVAHEMGIIHRDLKPENIFLVEDAGSQEAAQIKLLDFGIAKVTGHNELETLTETGFICGTPLYISPEQSLGMPLDGRADLYSVGVLLFELIAGGTPFVADTPIALVMKHIHNEAPCLRDVNSSVQSPSALDDLVQRLLAKDRDNRPVSAVQVAKELDALARECEAIPAAAPISLRRSIETKLPRTTPAGLDHGDVQLGTGMGDRTMVELPRFDLAYASEPSSSTSEMSLEEIDAMRRLTQGGALAVSSVSDTHPVERPDWKSTTSRQVPSYAGSPKPKGSMLGGLIAFSMISLIVAGGVLAWVMSRGEIPGQQSMSQDGSSVDLGDQQALPTDASVNRPPALRKPAAEEAAAIPPVKRFTEAPSTPFERRVLELKATPAAPTGVALPIRKVVTIRSVPSAAKVVIRGQVVGSTPYAFEVTSDTPETTVIVSVKGYLPQSWRYDPKMGIAPEQEKVTLVLRTTGPSKIRKTRMKRKRVRWEE